MAAPAGVAAFEGELHESLQQLSRTVADAVRWLRVRPGATQTDIARVLKRVVGVVKNSLGILGIFAAAIDSAASGAGGGDSPGSPRKSDLRQRFDALLNMLPQLVLQVRTYMTEQAQQKPAIAHALYSYDAVPAAADPDAAAHTPLLVFQAGEQIMIEQEGDADGWARGSVGNRTGWFPADLVTIIDSGSSTTQNVQSAAKRLVEQRASDLATLFADVCQRMLTNIKQTALAERQLVPALTSNQQASRLVSTSVDALSSLLTLLNQQVRERQVTHLSTTAADILTKALRLAIAANVALEYVRPAAFADVNIKSKPGSAVSPRGEYDDNFSNNPQVQIFVQLADNTCTMIALIQLWTFGSDSEDDLEEFERVHADLVQNAKRFVELIQYTPAQLQAPAQLPAPAPSPYNPANSDALLAELAAADIGGGGGGTEPPRVQKSATLQRDFSKSRPEPGAIRHRSISGGARTAFLPTGTASPDSSAGSDSPPRQPQTSQTLRRGRRPTSPWEAAEEQPPTSSPPTEGIKRLGSSENNLRVNADPATAAAKSSLTVASASASSSATASPSSALSPVALSTPISLPYTIQKPDFTPHTQTVVRALGALIKHTQNQEKAEYIPACLSVSRAIYEVAQLAERAASVFDDVMSPDLKRTQVQASNGLVRSMQTLEVSTRIASGVWPPDNALDELRKAAMEVATHMKSVLLIIDQIYERSDEYRAMFAQIEQQRSQKDNEYWNEYLLFERAEKDRVLLHQKTALANASATQASPRKRFDSVSKALTRSLGRDYETDTIRKSTRGKRTTPKKIIKVDESIQAIVNALVNDTKDVVFENELGPEGFPVIKAASLPRLIERLTFFYPDEDFTAVFLMTYEHFTTASELIQLLIQRFDYTIADLTPKQYMHFKTDVLMPTRLRVFNVLRRWLEQCMDDVNDVEKTSIVSKLTTFAETKMMETMEPIAKELIKLLARHRLKVEGRAKAETAEQAAVMADSEIPPPLLPKGIPDGQLKLEDLDTLEIARQLTLIEHRIFLEIRSREWLKQAWNKKDGDLRAPNIRRLIKRFNEVTRWVSHNIMNGTTPKHRAKLIKMFISTADRCRSLNNFNAVNAILSSLQSAPIHRLKKSWEWVSSKWIGVFDELAELMSPQDNFHNLRMSLDSVTPPCVPWLGLYLRDLTFLEDGHPTKLKGTDLINFDKCRKLANAVRDIEEIKVKRYALQDVPEIVSLLLDNEGHLIDEKEQFERSLQVEPKEAAVV